MKNLPPPRPPPPILSPRRPQCRTRGHVLSAVPSDHVHKPHSPDCYPLWDPEVLHYFTSNLQFMAFERIRFKYTLRSSLRNIWSFFYILYLFRRVSARLIRKSSPIGGTEFCRDQKINYEMDDFKFSDIIFPRLFPTFPF